MEFKRVVVTGGAGFIGANYVHYVLARHPHWEVVVIDKLTYAGNLDNLASVRDKIEFVQADIVDMEKMTTARRGRGGCPFRRRKSRGPQPHGPASVRTH